MPTGDHMGIATGQANSDERRLTRGRKISGLDGAEIAAPNQAARDPAAG